MELEKIYPLVYFERNMCDFIQMLLEDMDIPALDKVRSLSLFFFLPLFIHMSRLQCDNIPDITSPLKSPEDLPEIQFIPSLYKYPGDGSLLMPEIPDVIDEDTQSKKRSAVHLEEQDDVDNKKIRHS